MPCTYTHSRHVCVCLTLSLSLSHLLFVLGGRLHFSKDENTINTAGPAGELEVIFIRAVESRAVITSRWGGGGWWWGGAFLRGGGRGGICHQPFVFISAILPSAQLVAESSSQTAVWLHYEHLTCLHFMLRTLQPDDSTSLFCWFWLRLALCFFVFVCVCVFCVLFSLFSFPPPFFLSLSLFHLPAPTTPDVFKWRESK